MTTESAVLDLVQRWAAAERDGDVSAFDTLLTSNFLGIGPVGFVLDVEQWVQRHRDGLLNHEFEVLEPHLREVGDVVLVEAVQRQRTTARGREINESFRVGMVAVRAGDEWRLAKVQLSGPMIPAGTRPSFAR
ncbi:nuclear transport factor 2 family protein [Nocardia stercoris]|uniref:Nuclear transport factor 2 family protein n=1 Tax=Nocardia stercoris TaxID=2483361 RepID=A0A3M2KY36_9NOCA|nr:nuclear transport factor 2 family protein [Nocardia stercoris]RMI30392.1 nuclear transport factor 2 family protein [Nocardia stercoris]